MKLLRQFIEELSDSSKDLSKIIVEELEPEDGSSRLMLKKIVEHIVGNSSESPLKTEDLWNYIMKQCIGYSEIVYLVCSYVAKRYPESK